MTPAARLPVTENIAINSVTIPERHRPVDEAFCHELAFSFQVIGQLHPILVRRLDRPGDGAGYELIAGRNRLEAMRSLGESTIRAEIRDCDDLLAEMIMYAENLFRWGLQGRDRDRAIARYAELFEELHPETVQHRAGGVAFRLNRLARATDRDGSPEPAPAAPVKSFAKGLAERHGVSTRTIERARRRGDSFDDDYAVFAAHRVNRGQQDRLTLVSDPSRRREIVGATLFECIAKHLGGLPALSALTGVYKARPPRGWSLPMLVFNVIGSEPQINNSATHWEYLDVQFTVLADDDEQAQSLAQAASDALTDPRGAWGSPRATAPR